MLKFTSILALLVSGHMALADLVLYTDRPAATVDALTAEYTKRTGEAVTVISAGYNDIVTRLQFEAAAPVADLVFTKDLVYLADLENKNLLQPIVDTAVTSAVEPYMQSPDKNWVAISFRARTIIYNSTKFAPGEIKNYSDLTFTDAKWAGREPLLCLRRSADAYNTALLGFFIESMGYDAAKNMVNGWMNNLAREPYSDDRGMIDAIVAGNCDVAVVNSYYLGQKLFENPALPVGIAFADQDGIGTHTNGTGMGVVKGATNASGAEKFISIALENDFQYMISGGHMDYPARIGLIPRTLVADWGTFKKAPVSWTKIGNNAELAKQLAAEVGY